MDWRPLRTINPSCFLSTCRAADAFILMGSPYAVVGSSFFFMSYKAATQQNASRFEPPPVHQFQALHPHFRRRAAHHRNVVAKV